MNATIDPTTNDSTDIIADLTTRTDDVVANVPSQRRRLSRTRRFVLAVIAASSAAVGGAVVLPTSAANAAVVTPYFGLDAEISCDERWNTVSVKITATPSPAYRGMTVSFQTWVGLTTIGGSSSAQWSQWSKPVQLWNNFQTLANVTTPASDKTYVRLYVQMSYWTPNGWSVPQGTWATVTSQYYSGMCVT